jgi:DNA phosphorothioation-dependent restriction protein DptG
MSETTYLALLRGINVGGKNKLPMNILVDMFVKTGCKNV